MFSGFVSFGRLILGTLRDLLPIILVIAFFQMVVLDQPFPDLEGVLVGLVLVMVGLALFIQGLEMGLFPLGESMAGAFARKGSLAWLLTFAFCLGFVVTGEAAAAAAEAGLIANDGAALGDYAGGLRYTVALSVGVALVLGVLRIAMGWPIHYFFIGGYLLVSVITGFAPPEIVGIAYDAGGVTTSTVTVPLVTALGVGLASAIKGRNPLIDGFGLIAFACLMPILFVLIYGMVV